MDSRDDRATARARAVQVRGGVIGVDDVFGLHSESRKICIEEGRVGIGVQEARDSYAEVLAALHEGSALFRRFRNKESLLDEETRFPQIARFFREHRNESFCVLAL